MSNRANDLPALLGGPAIRPQGPPPWPILDDDVLRALQAAYGDGSWGKYDGGKTAYLQDALARLHGVEHVLACGSGTFAVELAMRALQIGPGDEVIQSAYDYSGNFLGIHAVGAMPVLVDVHPDNWNLDPSLLPAALSDRTRAILVSHLHGGVVPMRDVMAFATEHKLKVIEDAAQMPGAIVQGRMAGTWGDAGILSFGGSKLLSAGRGGALLTRHATVHQRARAWQYRGNILSPLSELQAAVLQPQLEKLEPRNAVRVHSVAGLRMALADIPGVQPFVNSCEESTPGYYKLGLQLDSAKFGLSRDRLVAAMRAEGIALDEGFRALHVRRSPKRFRGPGTLSIAQRAHEGVLVLHHPVLLGTTADLQEVVDALAKIHASAALLQAL